MKGLLYKDFYSLLRTSKIHFIVFAVMMVYFVFGHQNYLFLLTEAAVFLAFVISTLGTVEKNIRWNVFVGTLPLSRAKIVFEKYLFILLLSSGAVVIYYLTLVLHKVIYANTFRTGSFGDLMAPAILFSVVTVSSCLNQIFTLCFDPLKGRNMHLSFMMLSIIIVRAAGISVLPSRLETEPVVFTVSALCVSIAVLAVSFVISYLFYRKKDLT